MTLTASQFRALEWLPSDGSWRTDMDSILRDLRPWKRIVQKELAPIWAADGGGGRYRYRLTPAGIAFKAQMEQDK